jgi:hypothetical protein
MVDTTLPEVDDVVVVPVVKLSPAVVTNGGQLNRNASLTVVVDAVVDVTDDVVEVAVGAVVEVDAVVVTAVVASAVVVAVVVVGGSTRIFPDRNLLGLLGSLLVGSGSSLSIHCFSVNGMRVPAMAKMLRWCSENSGS